MNIFYLNHDITQCALSHCNKHIISQIKESCQLLSTAHRILDGLETLTTKNNRKKTIYILPDHRDNILLAATHKNHPCALWVRESAANYEWLYNLTIELCKEYTFRYNKVHKYESDGVLQSLKKPPFLLARGPMTPFAQAMPDQYKHSDAVTAYRNYYIGEKSHMFQYKNRDMPDWILDTIIP